MNIPNWLKQIVRFLFNLFIVIRDWLFIKHAKIVSLLIVGFFASLIFVLITLDGENTDNKNKIESQTKQLDSGDEEKIDAGNKKKIESHANRAPEKEEIKYQLDFLYHTRQLDTNTLESKENAAWAAFALYMTGLGLLIFKKLEFFKVESTIWKIIIYNIILISFVIIAFSVFAFIQAQYSAIYKLRAHSISAHVLLERIIQSGKPLNNFIDEKTTIDSVYLNIQKPKEGQLQPLHNLVSFLKLKWTKSKNRKMTRENIQVASIYTLMILFNLFLVGRVLSQIHDATKKT